MKRKGKESDVSDIIGGTLNIMGFNIDLAKLISSPAEVTSRLEELREKLKKAGGREVLSDEEWKSGEVSVSGQVRTRGILGEREYHIGVAGHPSQRKGKLTSQPPEPLEPPVDVFHEAGEIVVVAEVPGVELSDLELKVQDNVFSLSSKPKARKSYQKKIELGAAVDGEALKATCRNGILEVHLTKKNA
ncbi:MAG: Hsp20/alpha crystallin family protein [Chloroflexota bacterium]|nr:Hsp20/alpha crystallin family protein [Chloroflexota bacterium]